MIEFATQLDSPHFVEARSLTCSSKRSVVNVELIPSQNLAHHAFKILVTRLIGNAERKSTVTKLPPLSIKLVQVRGTEVFVANESGDVPFEVERSEEHTS